MLLVPWMLSGGGGDSVIGSSSLICSEAKAIISKEAALTHICQDREIVGVSGLENGPVLSVLWREYRVVLILS